MSTSTFSIDKNMVRSASRFRSYGVVENVRLGYIALPRVSRNKRRYTRYHDQSRIQNNFPHRTACHRGSYRFCIRNASCVNRDDVHVFIKQRNSLHHAAHIYIYLFKYTYIFYDFAALQDTRRGSNTPLSPYHAV
jgi:hypothetical protein